MPGHPASESDVDVNVRNQNKEIKTAISYEIDNKEQPLVVDQSLEIVGCEHLPTTESDAPADLPHYLSACQFQLQNNIVKHRIS